MAMTIDWWPVIGDKYMMMSSCGNYRIIKKPMTTHADYYPQHLERIVNKEGTTIESWKNIEKPKQTADQAKETCEKYAQNNK